MDSPPVPCGQSDLFLALRMVVIRTYVATGEVTTLEHEVLDDTVEGGALEVEGLAGLADTLLASAEGAEVLCGLRR
jgi:hypothetical protein